MTCMKNPRYTKCEHQSLLAFWKFRFPQKHYLALAAMHSCDMFQTVRRVERWKIELGASSHTALGLSRGLNRWIEWVQPSAMQLCATASLIELTRNTGLHINNGWYTVGTLSRMHAAYTANWAVLIEFLHIFFAKTINARWGRGGCSATPPLRFFANISKTAARSVAAFDTLVDTSFQTLVKMSYPGRSRSGQQVTASDLT